MNWFFMVLSAVAGGLATWFWSVRKVRRQVPVYGPAPQATSAAAAAGTAAADGATAATAVGLASTAADEETAETEPTVAAGVTAERVGPVDVEGDEMAEAGIAASAAPVEQPEAAVQVPEQDALSGLEIPATAAGDDGAAVGGAAALAGTKHAKGARASKSVKGNAAADDAAAGSVAAATLVGDVDNPNGWTIKGNADSGLYHTSQSPWYGRTKAEAWFETEDAAQAAGFVRWDRKSDKSAKDAKSAKSAKSADKGATDAKTVKVEAAAAAEVAAPVEAAALVGDLDNPNGWTIKGNADSGLYHTSESPWYGRTKAEAWFETEHAAQAAGFVRWDRKQKAGTEPAALAEVPDGPYGPGSAAAADDGSGPEGWTIKGNADSGLYHGPKSPWYGRTKAEAWFQTEEAAQAAGFARWDSRKKK